MYCPRCGHSQSSDHQRFCSKCGLALDGVADFLVSGEHHFGREKMEIVGISLLLATLLILLIYFTVFGAIALPHLPAKPNFLVIWIVFLSVSLGLSTAGIICLLRSGFFKKLRERQVRLQLSELYKRIASLEKRETGKLIEENSTVSMPQGSVTEATTRQLEEPRDVLPRSKEP